MKLRSLFTLLLPFVASVCFAAVTDEAALQRRVSDLLAQMTEDEKIGQLMQYSAPGAETGPVGKPGIEDDIRKGRCGSMLNVYGAKRTREWQELAVKNSRLHLPMLFGYDVIHGYRTIFPVNLGQAASWDLAAIEKSERVAAYEASSAGVHWTFAPMVDIARDPRWGRIVEGSGEDPFLGSAIARARVRGFQGDDFSKAETVVACAKHFAGYGAAQAGRDYHTTDIPEITLRDIYLPPFHAAVEAGVGTFMAAFNDLNNVPCSANRFLLTKVLREEWGFKGFVVSDWMSARELIPHGIAVDDAEACRIAMNAGLDMDMEGRVFGPELANEIKAGRVDARRLDAAVTAILMTKARLGLLDDPYRYCNEEREKTAMLRPEHLEATRDLARKSCVLLKNAKQALPLEKNVRIALIGQLAETKRDLVGPWEAQGKAADAVSFREAFEKTYPNRVTFVEGVKGLGGDRSGFNDAIAAAKKADVVVAVMGEGWYMSGEAASRTSIDLPGLQLELLTELKKTGKPVVLVLLTGRPLALAPVLEQADAVLLAWFPGTMGGPAIVDLVSGAFNPSGKLPVTFPRVLGQVPIFYNAMRTGRPLDADPNDKFRSRYLDVENTPQFPFGYGLSYTKFEYTGGKVGQATLASDGEQRVSVTLKNTGKREGTEVVQLYVRDLVGSVTRPLRELKGFERVTLKPGESREVVFTLKPQDLAFHHIDMSFAPEAGKFEVYVGGDSTAPKIGEFDYAPAKM